MTYTIDIARFTDDKETSRETIYEGHEENGGVLIIANAEEVGVNHIKTEGNLRLYFSDSCVLDQQYVDIAAAPCKHYRDILPPAVVPELLCFTIDTHWEPSEQSNDNSVWKIDIAKASKWLRNFTGYRYEIRLREFWVEEWSDAQFHAAILSQLLRIDPTGDGSIRKYSIEFQDALTATFGQGYLNRDVDIPDVLEEKVKIRQFREASGQITLDDLADPPEETGEAKGSATVVISSQAARYT